MAQGYRPLRMPLLPSPAEHALSSRGPVAPIPILGPRRKAVFLRGSDASEMPGMGVACPPRWPRPTAREGSCRYRGGVCLGSNLVLRVYTK
jgi:hypothetical protein